MTSYLYYNYYYRYRDVRKNIKQDLINNDISGAKIKLDQYIIENDNYINNNNIPNTGITFTSIDNLSLHHAKDHIIFANIPEQKQATQDALSEQ